MAHAEIRADGKRRCPWAESAPEFPAYHDTEWGFPVADDVRLFEKLCLEGFQSGLSWRTILVKRDNFRTAFAGFDFHVLASWGEPDVCRLLQNAGIVRHRGKIEAVLNNAQRACELVTEAGSLAAFLWQYEPDPEQLPTPQTRSTCAESVALSRALKKRGWKFVGPTTLYAFMQSMGMVNDHALNCASRGEVARSRQQFESPAVAVKSAIAARPE